MKIIKEWLELLGTEKSGSLEQETDVVIFDI